MLQKNNKHQNTKTCIQTELAKCVSIYKRKIVELLHNINIFNNLVELINQIQQSLIAIKPNRCFERRGRTCNKSSAIQGYK